MASIFYNAHSSKFNLTICSPYVYTHHSLHILSVADFIPARFGGLVSLSLAEAYNTCNEEVSYSGVRVQGPGFRVQGSGVRGQGSGVRGKNSLE